MDARSEPWGRTAAGEPVVLVTLERDGVRARLSSFGATWVSFELPDRAGETEDVLLGFDSLAGYESPRNPYLGGLVGRCANRIGGARFRLDGREFPLSANEGRHHLHGGRRGFDRRVWRAELDRTGCAVRFERESPDGEEGYPGRLDVRATYALGPGGALTLECEAGCDAPTVFNPTQHAYFDLSGTGSILEHELELCAARLVAVDPELIPTGELEPVQGSPWDFRSPHAIGARIEALRASPARGYDLCYVLDPDAPARDGMRRAARLSDPCSGRTLELCTSLPGLQLYTGNHLDGLEGRGGRHYRRHAGLCLETQRFPDSPNRPAFPSVVLRPDQRYLERTRFSPGIAGRD